MGGLGNKEIFAENLKNYLEQYGMTATDLSIKLDIPLSTISNWLHCASYPRIDKIEMIANLFGISKADLVEEHNEYYVNSETAKIAQEIAENKDLKILFDTTRTCSPEDMQKVIAMVKAFKGEI